LNYARASLMRNNPKLFLLIFSFFQIFIPIAQSFLPLKPLYLQWWRG